MTPRVFYLQFFAEEKTEAATPRKRQKTREEGQVAKSQDLSASVVLISGLLALYSLAVFMWTRMTNMLQTIMRHLSSDMLREAGWWILPTETALHTFFSCWLPLGLLTAVAAAAIMVYQVGFKVATKPLIPKPDRFNPVSGLKKIASMRTLVELLKGILKALILLGMLFFMLRNERDLLVSVMLYPAEQGVELILGRIWGLALRMAVVLFIIAIVDYGYQKWEFEKSIKMSKQEIKEEYKQMEGDPLIKRKIRQKQRELAMGRMMSDVPKADVVVTNPTHIAIAIQYDSETMPAPIVVAKGEGFIAEKIREIAAEHKIPIVENKPLARSLLAAAEIGEEIPQDLYRAVAEVLAFVYRLKGAGKPKKAGWR